jgi:hypothetical protein
MTCARTSIEDMPGPMCRPLDSPDDLRRQRVEMAGIKQCRAVPKLHWTIAARSWDASLAAPEIDVALAGEIEAMPVSADESACRSGEPRFTKRAPE